MDDLDIFASKPAPTQENDALGFGSNDQTVNIASNDPKEDSSWVIENNPDVTSTSQSDFLGGSGFDNFHAPTTTSQSDVLGGHGFDAFSTAQSSTPLTTDQSDALGGNAFDDFSSTPPPTISQSDALGGNAFDGFPSTSASTTGQSDVLGGNAFDDFPTASPTIGQSDALGGNAFDDFPSVPATTGQSDGLVENAFDDFPTAPPTIGQSDVLGGSAFDDFSSSYQSSTPPATFNDDIFGYQSTQNEQSNSFPSTSEEVLSNDFTNTQLEDKSSFGMFSTEDTSPLEALNKRRQQEIAEKDAVENRKIDELRQQAKHDLECWYNERQRQMEQKRQTMKHEENDLRTAALEKSSKESCDRAKVIRLVDFSQGSQLTKSKKDISRMKTCIVDAKRINDAKKLANGV